MLKTRMMASTAPTRPLSSGIAWRVVAGLVVMTLCVNGSPAHLLAAPPLAMTGPPAMPTDGRALLVVKINTDESILQARLAAIARRLRQDFAVENKPADRLYSRLPKPPRGQHAVAHLDPARAPIERAREEIHAWKGAIAGKERIFLDLEDSRTGVADMAVLTVQRAVANSRLLLQTYAGARAAAASLASGEQLHKPKDEMNLRRITAEARAGRFEATRRLQAAYQEVLTALEQGGPSEYQPRYDAWIQAGVAAARRREQQWQAYQDQFAALMAGIVVGLPALAMANVAQRRDAAVAAKFADPNYDTTMAQTRQAYREACEADGGVFVDGTGDHPGDCHAK